jgi:hypothetical protein
VKLFQRALDARSLRMEVLLSFDYEQPRHDIPRRRSGWTRYHLGECHARSRRHLTRPLRYIQTLRGPRRADGRHEYPYRERRRTFQTFVGTHSLWRHFSCGRYGPSSKVRYSALLEVRESLGLAGVRQSDRLRCMLPRSREHVPLQLEEQIASCDTKH